MKARDSVVLISGANRGIGKGFAEEFLKAGARKIYLGTRDTEAVRDFVAQDPERLVPLQLDITYQCHIKAAARNAGDINILINNAGVLHGGSLLDEDRVKKAHQEMDVNYFGPLAMINEFAPIIEANGGGVIANVSSVAGLVAMPGMPTYSTSKAAVHFLTLEARMELSGLGIHVMGIYPGPVDTDMVQGLAMPKIPPDEVARETIRAMESGESHVFPDPVLKDIYSVLHKTSEHTAGKMQTALQPKAGKMRQKQAA